MEKKPLVSIENKEIEDCKECLKTMSNSAPLLNKRVFGGPFQQGDILDFMGATLVTESCEGVTIYFVRAILVREKSRRGVFIPFRFFSDCFYYKGSGADFLTTFPNCYAMLKALACGVSFGVKEVEQKVLVKHGIKIVRYNYHLDLIKLPQELNL